MAAESWTTGKSLKLCTKVFIFSLFSSLFFFSLSFSFSLLSPLEPPPPSLIHIPQGGFQLGQPVVESIIKKFKATNARYGAQGLEFEQFLQLSAFLGQIRSTFMVYDTNRSGFITINLEQLVQVCWGVGGSERLFSVILF